MDVLLPYAESLISSKQILAMFLYKYRPIVIRRHVYSCRQPSDISAASHFQISKSVYETIMVPS